jgi:tetratricopeptide (TPR) repeat protein
MIKVTSGALAVALLATLSIPLPQAAFAFGSTSNTSTSSSSGSVDTTPPASATAYNTALNKINAGAYADAIPLLQQSLAEDPQNPDALNELGFSYRKIGHLPESLDAYQKALAINPGHIDANEYLGELYLQMKKPDMAKRQLDILSRLCPSGCEQRTELQDRISAYKG